MFNSSNFIDKTKLDVQLDLIDGSKLVGAVFLSPGQRLSDLLNDDRQFLPFDTTSGLISNLSKTAFVKVTQLDQKLGDTSVKDPYKILGVSATATDDEVHDAYRRRALSYHPDQIQSAGLAVEFTQFATKQMARINDAYERIVEMRNAVSDHHDDHPAEDG